MNEINFDFTVYLLLILLGYSLKKFKLIKEKDCHVLATLVLYVTLPAIVFNIFNNISVDSSMLILFIVSISFGIFMNVLAFFVFFKVKSHDQKGLLIGSSIGFNIGLFAYPFIETAFGLEGLKYLVVFDLGNAFVLYVLSYIANAYYSPTNKEFSFLYILKKLAVFVPLQCYIIAIILNVNGIVLPSIIKGGVETLAAANTPLVLILLGLYLNFKFEKQQILKVFSVLSLRYTFGILVGVLLFIFLPLDICARIILLIALILPIGLITIPYSIHFNYDTKLAGALVNGSNIISFIFIWIILFSTTFYNIV